MIKNFFKHLGLVIKHRHHVFINCCKCGLPWRGLMHDLSKFSWLELKESVKYYNGKVSPLVICRQVNGHSLACIHHTNKNKHHIEYWYDHQCTEQIDMPYKYAVEAVCDKIAANKCYFGKEYTVHHPLKHWQEKGRFSPTNDRMRNFFTAVFNDLITLGEKGILNKKYMKATYNKYVLLKNEKGATSGKNINK